MENAIEPYEIGPTISELQRYILGAPKRLDPVNLPTLGEILLHYHWLIENGQEAHMHNVVLEVEDIWESHEIPHTEARMAVGELAYINYYRWLQRNHGYLKLSRYRGKYLWRLYKFRMTSSRLLDIARCHCKIDQGCRCMIIDRVPTDKRAFLTQQRRGRLIFETPDPEVIHCIHYCHIDRDIQGVMTYVTFDEPNTNQITDFEARNIPNIIFQLTANSFEVSDNLRALEAIYSDGTGVDVLDNGNRRPLATGVISLFEARADHPLQHLVSMRYTNDKMFGCLCEETGLLEFTRTGDIKMLRTLGFGLGHFHRAPWNTTIEAQISTANMPPHILHSTLENGERYLYELVEAMRTHRWSVELIGAKPPSVHGHNWAEALAARVIRLYFSYPIPPPRLANLARYVIHVYAPVAFYIRRDSLCQHGSRHTFRLMNFYQNQAHLIDFPNFEQHLQKYGFYLHPENILLAMITDTVREVRDYGLRIILAGRQRERLIIGQNASRTFNMPSPVLTATNYTQMINWPRKMREPPITKRFDTATILSHLDSGDILDLPKYPC